jgi:hypothetical protein
MIHASAAQFVADGRLATIIVIQAMNGMQLPVQTTKHVRPTVPSTVQTIVAHTGLRRAVTR